MFAYQHAQPGTSTRWLLTIGIVLAGGGLLFSASQALPLLSLVLAILVVGLALFHNLTVAVSTEWVTWRFGLGLIHKRIAIGRIQRARIIKTRWYHGWGIHHTGRGWLYNVSGFDAIELHLQDGQIVQIGTDEPQQLLRAIEGVMGAT